MKSEIRFSKMHGIGNDFVIIDRRNQASAQPLATATVVAMADRHLGIGFDQLLTIEPPRSASTFASYQIWNADGSAAMQCGNGARCIAAWLLRDAPELAQKFSLDSPAGIINIERRDDAMLSLTMGLPEFSPSKIPLQVDQQLTYYPLNDDALPVGNPPLRFGAASMGNPHALIEVADIASAPVASIGPLLQRSELFPDSVNVGFAQVLSPAHIRLRVYERGAGETLACGSGACAAVAILIRQNRVARSVQVDLPGGSLQIDWPDDQQPMRMAGPATFVFDGVWL